jgi:hypothetical protein
MARELTASVLSGGLRGSRSGRFWPEAAGAACIVVAIDFLIPRVVLVHGNPFWSRSIWGAIHLHLPSIADLLLVPTGILLWLRRPGARPFALAAATCKILVAATAMALTAISYSFSRRPPTLGVAWWASRSFNVAVAIAFPCFIASLVRSRRDEVRTWRRPSRSPAPAPRPGLSVREAWPVILGWVTVALGVQNVLGYVASIAFTGEMCLRRIPDLGGDWPAALYFFGLEPRLFGALVVPLALSIQAVACGLVLLRRRRAGVVLHLVFAAAAVGYLCIMAAHGWLGVQPIRARSPGRSGFWFDAPSPLASLLIPFYPWCFLAWFALLLVRRVRRGAPGGRARG